MKQTAMQLLISKLKEERLTNPVDSPLNIGLTVAIGLATELLEVETKDIKDAYDAGWAKGYAKNYDGSNKYLIETFTQ